MEFKVPSSHSIIHWTWERKAEKDRERERDTQYTCSRIGTIVGVHWEGAERKDLKAYWSQTDVCMRIENAKQHSTVLH